MMDLSLDHLDLRTRKIVLKLMRQDLEEDDTGEIEDDAKLATKLRLADLDAQTSYLYNLTPRDDTDESNDEDSTHEDDNHEDVISSPNSTHLQLPLVLGPTDLREARECLICTESFHLHDLARLPCNHEYCRGCLQHLFTSALTDEELFPARCCRQNIPVTGDQIQFFLGGELVGKYGARTVEMETPDRTYCHKPGCSTFIPPQTIASDIATCFKCLAKTCSVCKAATHEGTDCPEDEAAKQLLEMAKKEGWKQCYACNKIVELKEGCNHMTCRCGAEFCYVCGQVWKGKSRPGSCNCNLFDEETLARQAAREAARDPGFHHEPQARQQQIVQQRRDHIVRNHACAHSDYWDRVDGSFTCQGCNDRLPTFILECKWCDMQLCVRCKVNRLR